MNTEGALLHLAEATSEAVRDVLSALAPEASRAETSSSCRSKRPAALPPP